MKSGKRTRPNKYARDYQRRLRRRAEVNLTLSIRGFDPENDPEHERLLSAEMTRLRKLDTVARAAAQDGV